MSATLTRCALSTALALAFSAASAAPLGERAPAARPAMSAPLPPGAAVIHTPAALNANLVVQGNGVQIDGRLAAFGTTTGIVSTVMVQPTPAQRARLGSRAQACSFTASFTMKNAGGMRSDAVDVHTWLRQPRGPQVGKIADQVYGNPALAPGGIQTWSTMFTLEPGSYVFHLVIDPQHLNRRYAVALKANCGFGGVPQMRAPKALGVGPQPLHAPSGIPPSGGIGIVPSGGIGIARGPVPQTVKVGPGTKLSEVLALPDNAVLEGPTGQHVTVAEFKHQRQQMLARLQRRRPSAQSAGKSIRVYFPGHGQSLAQKIAGLRASEVAAAQRVMASPGFNRGGQLPTERTQSDQLGNQIQVSNQARMLNCALRSPGVTSVNGRRSGVAFTPGGIYAIEGCGFGNLPGKAYVVGNSGGSGNVAVQIPLVMRPQDWSNQAIRATIDARLSGVGDISNATLVVQPAKGASLQQTGDQFYATRETHPLIVPSTYVDFNASTDWTVRYYPSRGIVNRGYCTGSDTCQWAFPDGPRGRTAHYCAGWPAAAKDVWRLDKVAARIKSAGFEIDDNSIVVQNTTSDVGVDFFNGSNLVLALVNHQRVDMGSFSSWEQGNDLNVQFQGHSEYFGQFVVGVAVDTYSYCYSSYSVRISVSGPRGVPMPSL
jgi:hypothetical protein